MPINIKKMVILIRINFVASFHSSGSSKVVAEHCFLLDDLVSGLVTMRNKVGIKVFILKQLKLK